MAFDQFIFSDRVSRSINAFVRHPEVIPNVLCFHGFPGVGKTSFAQFLADQVSYNTHYFPLNERALKGTFIEAEIAPLFRHSLHRFLHDEDKAFDKTIILDEFHNLSPKEQDRFKVVLEESDNELFIICLNTTRSRSVAKILSDAVLSRAHHIDFNVKNDELSEVVEKVVRVFPELSSDRIQAWLPDMRRITREAMLLRNIPQYSSL